MEEGVGLTHLSVTLGNYYANYEKKEVLILEVVDPPQEMEKRDVRMPASPISALLTEELLLEGGLFGFRRLGITYYPNLCAGQAEALIQKGTDVTILLFRSLNLETYHSFLSCDLRMAVGAITPWHRRRYFEFLKEYKVQRQWIKTGDCFVLNGFHSGAEDFQKNFGDLPREIPLIKDPEYLTGDEISSLQKFLNQIHF